MGWHRLQCAFHETAFYRNRALECVVEGLVRDPVLPFVHCMGWMPRCIVCVLLMMIMPPCLHKSIYESHLAASGSVVMWPSTYSG